MLSHVAPQQSPPYCCNRRNLMFTALSETYRLDINLDFEGLPGLDFFLTCFTWALSPLHIYVVYSHSLLSGFAGGLLTHHSLVLSPSLPPSPGAASCTILTNHSICSPSQSSLLHQVPHPHHSSPAPIPDGHQDVHFYVNYF